MRLLLFIALALSASAQNFAVRWTGENTNGIPYYWPIILRSIGTNITAGGAVVLSRNELDHVIVTNRPAWDAAQDQERATLEAVKQSARTEYDGALAVIFEAAKNIRENTTTLTTLQIKAEALRIQLNALKILTNIISTRTDP